MKTLFLMIMVLCLCEVACSQKTKPDTSNNCSNTISLISYYWKLDSLANNGFRLYTYRDLLKCKIDKVTRAFLLDRFGKPNTTRKTNHGTEYVYYYYDSKTMPKEFGRPFEAGYISFLFGEYDKYLSSIDEGDIDY